jgi:CRP/FNR family transcriptional regulator, dissimilatory nitrate respiration regulator
MKLENYIDVICKSTLFQNLTKDEILCVLKFINYKISSYSKDDIIFQEDENCENLGLILEGNVEIQKIDSNGKVLAVAQFDKSDIFGELLIFSDHNRFPMTIVSKSNSTILHIAKDSVVKLCQSETSFLYAYLKLVSNKAFILNQKLKEVTLKTIRQQITEFIFMKSAEQDSDERQINMTKKEWADKIGVQRPSLSRELIKMKEEGLIDFERSTVTILDRHELKRYL